MTEQTNQTNKQKDTKSRQICYCCFNKFFYLCGILLVSVLGNFYSVRVNPTRVSSHTSIQTSEFIELRV